LAITDGRRNSAIGDYFGVRSYLPELTFLRPLKIARIAIPTLDRTPVCLGSPARRPDGLEEKELPVFSFPGLRGAIYSFLTIEVAKILDINVPGIFQSNESNKFII
jgi:hypothetical protein